MLEKYFSLEEIENLKNNYDLLFKTLEIVLRLFNGKVDKSGVPYISHLMKVYEGVSEYKEKIVALLHDVVEDTEVTFEDLKELGYDDEIIFILSYLTKKKGEYYPDYIDRLISSENIHVLNIKLSDLKHNMDITRITNPSVNDYERVNKRYAPAYLKVESKLNELLNKKEKEK